VNKLNGKLQDFERGSFLHEEGLNGRPWFKHIVFASGRYTGYAGQKLPGLTEAVEDLDFKNAVKWTNILKKSVNYAAVKLSQ
jgi:N-acetylated-alpha-linked acidic dipeptidase